MVDTCEPVIEGHSNEVVDRPAAPHPLADFIEGDETKAGPTDQAELATKLAGADIERCGYGGFGTDVVVSKHHATGRLARCTQREPH
ncbi:MAG: hypothetical protein NVS3B21_03230 [Acidimicrobiales bacterium]